MQIQAPSIPVYGQRPLRHRSRRQGCIVSVFVGILLLLCSCTASLALYIVFSPPVDIVIMGLDSRDSEGTVTRTDSIILMGVNPHRLNLSLLSIPRDVFIDVPRYGLQRINTINMLAEIEEPGTGPELLSQSIENSFGIGVDNYIRLDFQAFTALVDAVGGVKIDVPYRVVDNAYPTADYGTISVTFEEGKQAMDGETALIYARTRHQDDDYRRAERQQQVTIALSQKLVNPLNWGSAWFAIQSHMETDLNIFQFALITPSMLFSAGDIDHLVINRDYVLPGNGFVYPNYEALSPYIEANFD